ncbi:NUDIX domain-containing protein [Actinomycetospora chlora]|uniref:NUDIX domain-containing protein n=1 Tax=Actinomycetospora chlora TaxID=663608 RepID=A0ABP9AT56_9PSEU
MPKRDYFDSPDAPLANDLTPVLNVAVFNAAAELLLIRRSDNGFWALPGGYMEVGERFAEAAARELVEETGIAAEVTGIVGVYSDPRHVTAHDDGIVHQQCTICLRARPIGGQPGATAEASVTAFFDRRRAMELHMHPTMRLRVEHAFDRPSDPYIG